MQSCLGFVSSIRVAQLIRNLRSTAQIFARQVGRVLRTLRRSNISGTTKNVIDTGMTSRKLLFCAIPSDVNGFVAKILRFFLTAMFLQELHETKYTRRNNRLFPSAFQDLIVWTNCYLGHSVSMLSIRNFLCRSLDRFADN